MRCVSFRKLFTMIVLRFAIFCNFIDFESHWSKYICYCTKAAWRFCYCLIGIRLNLALKFINVSLCLWYKLFNANILKINTISSISLLFYDKHIELFFLSESTSKRDAYWNWKPLQVWRPFENNVNCYQFVCEVRLWFFIRVHVARGREGVTK